MVAASPPPIDEREVTVVQGRQEGREVRHDRRLERFTAPRASAASRWSASSASTRRDTDFRTFSRL